MPEGEDEMKVAVVGVGGTGSAACRHLAKAGHTVVGYEQFAVGHTRGSSHGESRIIRYTYPNRTYTEMMGDAYPLWSDLEEEAGEELFVRCGGLLMGPPDHTRLVETRNSLEAVGLPYEELPPDAVTERFPAFRLAPDEVGLYQKDSGLLRATRCTLANARLAKAWGAEIREGTAVTDVIANGQGAIVRTTNGGEEAFDGVVVTAGPWMGKLLSGLGMPLRIQRRQIVYLDIARQPETFAPGVFPVWIDATARYYGFPSDGRIPGVKLASHLRGYDVDPDRDDRTPDTETIHEAAALATRRFPNLTGNATHTQVCLYTTTPDEDFIIDRVPDLPNVYLVSGCSGHGFKFTVLLGKIAAGLVTGVPYPRDLSRFSLARFTHTA